MGIYKSFFISCFIVLGLISNVVKAQNPNADSTTTNNGTKFNRLSTKMNWSQEYTEPTNSEIQKIIGTENGGFYALRQRKGGFFGSGAVRPVIEYYNAQSKLVKMQEIDLDYKGNERYLKDVVMLGGKMYVLSYYYNQKHTTTYLFAQEVQKSSLKLNTALIKIAEQEASNKNHLDVFNYVISKDSSRLAVFNVQPNDKEKEEFAISVYDDNLTEQWSKITTLPYKSNRFRIDESQVDKKGNFYALGIIYSSNQNNLVKDGKPTFQYDLVAFRRDSIVDFNEYKITIKDKIVTNLTFRVAEDDDLVLSGFYSEKTASGIKGSCFFKINTRTKDMTSISTRPLDFNFITANLSNKDKARAKEAADQNNKQREAELINYNLDKLILRSDGGAILIAEQYYVEERYRNNSPFGYSPYSYGFGGYRNYSFSPYGYGNNYYNNYGRADYYFHYNDIIVLNIRPDGEIEWSARIPKRQVSINDNGVNSSYAQCTIADKLVFIYNEDARNLNPNKKKQIEGEPDRSSIVAVAEVDRNGNVTIGPLFGNSAENIVTRPKICRQIGKYEMAIYGERGRTYRFGNLTFDRTVAPN